MAEVLGRLDPEADTSMLVDPSSLSELERAQVDEAVSRRAAELVEEARLAPARQVAGKFLVALQDGRVTTTSFDVRIGKDQEE